MKKYFTFLVVLSFISLIPLQAQNFEFAYETGLGNADRGRSVIQTNDGGYASIGYTQTEANGTDILFIRTDSGGQEIFRKTYGGSYDERGYSLAQLSDESFVLACMSKSFNDSHNEDWYILKVNQIGDILWTKNIGNSGVDIPYKVIATTDDKVYIAGRVYGFQSATLNTKDGYLLKLNTDGNIIWSHIVDYGTDEEIYDVYQCQNGDLAMCGKMYDSSAEYNTIVVNRVASDGVEKWITKYSLSSSNVSFGITEMPNTDLIVVGYQSLWSSGCDYSWNLHLKRLSANGDVLKEKGFRKCGDQKARDVVAVTEDEFVVVGYGSRKLGGASEGIFIEKYDTTLTVSWSRIFGGYERWNESYSVEQTADSGFVCGGFLTNNKSETSSPIYDEDMIILKTDVNGKVDHLYVSENPVLFGNVPVDSTVYDTICFVNHSFLPIRFSNHFDNSSQSNFAIVAGEYTGNDYVNPRAADTLYSVIRFTPRDTLDYAEEIDVLWGYGTWSLSHEINIPVVGRGRAEAEFSIDTIDYEETTVNSQEVEKFTIFNSGTTLLRLYALRIEPENSGFTFVNNAKQGSLDYSELENIDIAIGDSYEVFVQFEPETEGIYQAHLIIESNAVNSPDSIALKGEADGFLLVDELENNGVLVYPNPCKSKVYIESLNSKFSELKITDISGRIIIQKAISQKVEIIDLSGFKNGLYIMSIYGTKGLVVKKIFKIE